MGFQFYRRLVLSGIFLFACIVFLLPAGCAHFPGSGEDVSRQAAASETLHQIDPLDLKAATTETRIAEREIIEPAPAVLELSIEECRALVLENNLDLKVQLINPAIAAESVSQEEAKFEATFTAGVNYFKNNAPVPSRLDIEGSKIDGLRSELGINIPLRTGGGIRVDLMDFTKETDSEFEIYNPSYSNGLSASISQPLLQGAGRRASEYYIRIAELDRQITETQTRVKVIFAIAEADKVYWELYKARNLLEVRRQQHESNKALFDETEALVNVGSRAHIELIRTRAGIANTLKSIITAENNVRDRERELKRMLNKPGLGIGTETVLILSTQPDPVRYDIQRDKMVAGALENRMELLEAELEIAKNAATIDYRKNQGLPQVDLWYKYNINGLGPSRSDAYDLLVDNTYIDHSAGFQVSIPLGNNVAESRLRQAIHRHTQQLAGRESKKQLISYEVFRQIDQVEANWQGILASRQATVLNDDEYQAEKRLFELGMATSRDVLDAQTALADAQKDEISAVADYQISLIDLAYATGTLLGAAKVQWEPLAPENN